MEQVSVLAVGDVSTGFDPPEKSFDHVLEPLRSADVRFAHAERIYSERGSYQVQSGSKHARQPPQMAKAFKSVPFDVLSIASNHTGSWGPESVEDNAETFQGLSIPTVGSGRNIQEARRPAIVVRKGLRIAFLGYVSVIQPQCWATESRAGGAPMRAHTFYEPYEFQPGAPARVVTVPHAADLEHLVRDVREAKQNADHVFVSLHWGIHFMPRPCEYQSIVAHAAIEAGASAILGHHPHQPQGIELYKGGVIFYSIGNFAFCRLPGHKSGTSFCQPHGEYKHEDVYSQEPDPGFFFAYKRHFDESGIAFIDVDRQGLVRVCYLPTLMNDIGQPEVVRPGHAQFEKSLTYLNWAGKFIRGGVTGIKAAGDRFEIFARGSA